MHSDYVRTACIQQQLSPQELWAPRTPSPARQRHTSKKARGQSYELNTSASVGLCSPLPAVPLSPGATNTRSLKSERAKKTQPQVSTGQKEEKAAQGTEAGRGSAVHGDLGSGW